MLRLRVVAGESSLLGRNTGVPSRDLGSGVWGHPQLYLLSYLCSLGLPFPVYKWGLERDFLGLPVLRICRPGERSSMDAD